VLFLNWLLLGAAYLLILGGASGHGNFFVNFNAVLFWALFFVLIQSLLLAALALMFSTFSTTSLSAVFTLGIYLVGNNISQIRFLAVKTKEPVGAFLLNLAAGLLPNLEHFSLGTKVIYRLPIGGALVFHSVLYGVLVLAFVLALAGVLVQGRES
jgi:hypothetical protein